jgi:hypothetical protein
MRSDENERISTDNQLMARRLFVLNDGTRKYFDAGKMGRAKNEFHRKVRRIRLANALEWLLAA